jgi:hypothetical protein
MALCNIGRLSASPHLLIQVAMSCDPSAFADEQSTRQIGKLDRGLIAVFVGDECLSVCKCAKSTAAAHSLYPEMHVFGKHLFPNRRNLNRVFWCRQSPHNDSEGGHSPFADDS